MNQLWKKSEHSSYLILPISPSKTLKCYFAIVVGFALTCIFVMLPQNPIIICLIPIIFCYCYRLWQKDIELKLPNSIIQIEPLENRIWRLYFRNGRKLICHQPLISFRCKWFIILNFRVASHKTPLKIIVLKDSVPEGTFQLLFYKLS